MAKKNTKRKLIGLVSSLSNHRTYYTTKNTQNTTDPILLICWGVLGLITYKTISK